MRTILLAAWGGAALLGAIGRQDAVAQQLHGFTEPIEQIALAAPEPGVLSRIDVRQGDRVEAGQVIAVLDHRVLDAELEAAQVQAAAVGALAAATANYRLKANRLVKLRSLLQKGHANPEEIEQAAGDCEIAKAHLETARERNTLDKLAVERIRSQIARRVIRSPIDGVVLRVHQRPGEAVGYAQQPVAEIARIDALRAVFHLPTEQAELLDTGQQVQIQFSNRHQTAPAVIEFVSPVTDADSGSVRVEVRIDNLRGEIRSGLWCELAPLP